MGEDTHGEGSLDLAWLGSAARWDCRRARTRTGLHHNSDFLPKIFALIFVCFSSFWESEININIWPTRGSSFSCLLCFAFSPSRTSISSLCCQAHPGSQEPSPECPSTEGCTRVTCRLAETLTSFDSRVGAQRVVWTIRKGSGGLWGSRSFSQEYDLLDWPCLLCWESY